MHCPACRSESLGIVITPAALAGSDASSGADDAEAGVGVGPGRPYGEFGAGDRERFREAPPIGPADLERVRDLLATGGLAALVGRSDPPPAGRGR